MSGSESESCKLQERGLKVYSVLVPLDTSSLVGLFAMAALLGLGLGLGLGLWRVVVRGAMSLSPSVLQGKRAV